jgi:hypothetical protein
VSAGLHLVRTPDEVTHASIVELDRGYRAYRVATDEAHACVEKKIRLGRRLGVILAALPTAQGRRDPNGPPTKSEALARLGIPRQRAAEFEALARIEEETFEHYLNTARAYVGTHMEIEISMRGALALSPRPPAAGKAAVGLTRKQICKAIDHLYIEVRHLGDEMAGFDDDDVTAQRAVERRLERVVRIAKEALDASKGRGA